MACLFLLTYDALICSFSFFFRIICLVIIFCIHLQRQTLIGKRMERRLKYLFLLTFIPLFLGSCSDYEDDVAWLKGMLQEASGHNEATRQLSFLMEKQGKSYQTIQGILGGNRPLFDATSTGTSTDFGAYFIVPYHNQDSIAGGVIFPLDMSKERNVWSKDALLAVPTKLDAAYLNQVMVSTVSEFNSSELLQQVRG